MAKASTQVMIRKPERRPTLVAELAAGLAGEIESGRLAPGVRLPPEHELTATLGVSRATLREAIAALRRKLIATVPGERPSVRSPRGLSARGEELSLAKNRRIQIGVRCCALRGRPS